MIHARPATSGRFYDDLHTMNDLQRLSRACSRICCTALAISVGLFPQIGPALAEQESKPAADAAPHKAPKPSPQLTSEGVVQWQVRELSAEGEVADRIERCYRFASPDNRAYTGPLSRFKKMLQAPPYDVLLDAKHFLVGRATCEKNQAHVLLSVVNKKNELTLFRCFLSKQTTPEYKDCWMTDAVVPIGSAQKPAPPARSAEPSI